MSEEHCMKSSNKRRQTGIMGGTFNPIHMGHLLLAEAAYTEFGLDCVLFIPSGCSYMKDPSGILTGPVRIEMTRLAIEDNPHFDYSPIEIMREGNTYTYETLESLRQLHPDTDYSFIMGADSLCMLSDWVCPDRILQNARILAAVRDRMRTDELTAQAQQLTARFGGCIELLHLGTMEISSSDIRRRICTGRSIRYMVPEKVRNYIYANQLYMGETGDTFNG